MDIEVRAVSHSYMFGSPFASVAIRNINLKIQSGEFIGIVGHSGCGKTTLIQHLNGLLKPTYGKVLIDGIETVNKDIQKMRSKIGLVFQYPEHQLFADTVMKDLLFGLRRLGIDPIQMEAKVKSVLLEVGLTEGILPKSPFELSGGQKRRLAIAGVLVMEPDVLILDEPGAGLDPFGRTQIFDFIKKLHEEMRITVILVSHNMDDIAKYTDRLIVMNEGKIELDGRTIDILLNQGNRLMEIGLGVPQVTQLMKRLKIRNNSINDRLITVSEAKKELLRILGGNEK